MADGVSADFSELTQLSADLGKVPDNAGPFINSALQHTAVEVKKDTQESVKGGSRIWKALPRAISYDVATFQGFGSSVLKIDVGYEKAGAGNLGNIREFGAAGSSPVAPHNDLANALHKNEGDFQHGLEKALEDAEKKAGL